MEDIQFENEVDNKVFDIIVVGAGVAGSAFAYSLGKAGKRVLCIERDLSEPDRIVGELMQPGGVRALRELGMEDCLDGIDSSLVFGYGIFKHGKGTKLSYPKDSNGAIINGFSFHHGRFIQKLRLRASSCENVFMVEGTVNSLIEEDGIIKGVTYIESKKKDNSNENKENSDDSNNNTATTNNNNNNNKDLIKEVRAPLTVVCDGCFSNLRKSLVPENQPLLTSTFVGLVIKGVQLPFQCHGHVFLVDPAPILMYRIGSDEIRVLVDIPFKCPPNSELKEYLETVTAPQLPESLRESFLYALRNSPLKKMPNSRLPPNPTPKPGVLMIGDSWNMRHPLTGSGMTVCLSDCVILSKLITQSNPSINFTDRVSMERLIQKFTIQRKPLASTLNVLAGALYKVFSASNEHLRKACLGYLSLGGEFSAGPVALLSGLKPKPHILAMHFFAVAFYGVLKNILPFPTPARIRRCYQILCAASDIVVPLLRSEGVLKYIQNICIILRLTK
ncbi:squalene monooxygenase [Dictyostelium discoideum AX4]|uniref:Squalene monooxygenase n=1 Tax=Dictyostelium discoideum TaxID=44689 RepID=Q54BK7_DICDI|nr:squalene monooxygenase [Dictyostelium discoideum AX4]EAL60604.1 squalene monooxygenase [Dictyostelium discoideum AX4]|eukprot:XP_629022.1 squalene monooxygenase [Dictyostelium discoideum AX4]